MMIKNVFYGVMLNILTQWKNIQKELKKVDKKIACSLNNDETEFSVEEKKILKRLKYKIIFSLILLVMKISWFFQFMFLIKLLKAQQICCI